MPLRWLLILLLLVLAIIGLGSFWLGLWPSPEGLVQPSKAEFQEVEVRFEGSHSLTLAGTLTVPSLEGGRKPPAVLMIAGSGPVDRNENAPGFKSDIFKQIAHRLAQEGIASLRYDKRGVGRSEGDFRKACMTDLHSR